MGRTRATARREGIRRQLTRLRGPDKTANLVAAVSGTYAARVAGLAIGLATSILVARSLGPEGRGLVAAAATLMAVGVQLANLGLHTSNTYYVARDRRLLPVLLGNSLVLSLGVGCLGAIAAFAILSGLQGVAPVGGLLLALALAGIPIGLASLLLQNLLLGIHSIAWFNALEVLSRFVTLGLVTTLVVLAWATPEAVVASGIIAATIAGIGAFIRLWESADWHLATSTATIRAQVHYGTRAYLASLFAYLLLRGDVLIVQYLLGPQDTGYYAVAGSLADIMYLLPATIGLVLFPRLAAFQDDGERLALTRRTARFVAAAMAVLAGLAVVFATPLVTVLFGDQFLPAVAPFQILAIGAIFYGINGVMSTYLASVGFPWFGVWIWAAVLLVSVAADLVLLPRAGIVAAATVSAVAYAAVLAGQVWFIVYRRSAHAS